MLRTCLLNILLENAYLFSVHVQYMCTCTYIE